MRKRILILMLVMILIVPTILAEVVDCEISTTNLTWGNLNTTRWGGCIDEDNGIAYLQNLNCQTTYYTRCKNDTHDWGYQSFETENCGVDEPMIAIVLGMITLIAFFMLLGFRLDAIVPKMACYGVSLVEILNLMFLLYINEAGESLTSTLRVNFWVIMSVAFGIGVISLYLMTIKLVKGFDDEEDDGLKWSKK